MDTKAAGYVDFKNMSLEEFMDRVYIGIEYEPQFVLLNYPGSVSVNVSYNYRDISIVQFEESKIDHYKCTGTAYDEIGLYIETVPGVRWGGSYDSLRNLEVRTRPVKLKDLKKELDACTLELEYLVHRIAKVYGPTGLMYPDPPQTKHINLSSKWSELVSKIELWGFFNCDELSVFINTMDVVFGNEPISRLHIPVTYAVSEYEQIVKNIYDTRGGNGRYTKMINCIHEIQIKNNRRKTQCMMYSHTGEIVNIVRRLF